MNNAGKWFWLGLFLLASGWAFFLPLLGPTRWCVGSLLTVAGAAVNGLSSSRNPHSLSQGSLPAYALSGLVITALAPFPHRLGGLLLIGGAGLLWLAHPNSRLAGFSMGVLFSGILVVLTSACLPVVWWLGCRLHQLSFVAPMVCGVFKLFGHAAHSESGTVFVQGASGIQEYAIASEYLGWIFLVPAVLGAIIWHRLTPCRHPWYKALAFVLLVLAYALARYILLALLYLDLPAFRMFWNPWILCLSFLPLFIWLMMWRPRAAAQQSSSSVPAAAGVQPVNSSQLFGAIAIAISLCCLALAWGWEDPGQANERRLIIDEAHSAWEKIDRKYDTEWFGEESGYNYYCLAEFLGYYYQVRANTGKITEALLADCDILLLKTPTSAFTADEIDAIEHFVRRGGGVLLIGDHTNVFGTSTYLNAIARRFGLHYNYDATYDLPSGGLSFYEHPRLLPHPIVQALPPFLFGTSCTLDVPWDAAIPMEGYALRVAGHDYATTSFFTQNTDGPHVGFGLYPQLAAVKRGRGRVAAFTDSTVFSNFWMFLPGKPELLLGCTEWLNRQNLHPWRSLTLFAVGVALGTAVAFRLRKRFALQFPRLFAAGCLGLLAGVELASAANRTAYSSPVPHTRYRPLCFERQYSHFELPADTLMHPSSVDFHTFFVWSQRVGCVPRVSAELDSSLSGAGGLVMINPSGTIPGPSLQQLKDYVSRGGVLYVLDSPTNLGSAANQILSCFNLALTNCPLAKQAVYNTAGELVASNRTVNVTCGGQGILFTEKHQPLLSSKREGKGTVVFGGDAELFANASLGTTATVPDENQSRLYHVIFELFRLVER